ncbi:MAG: DUF2804 domain-containing protein [Deltaproteobacteria bacterium]|nr:DUF2804 domain-containing protein [Deltaproteobacteria bacterium]
MEHIISGNGRIRFGRFDTPVAPIDIRPYSLKTAMGKNRSNFIKKLSFKQFVFIGIIGPDIIFGSAVVNLKYITSGFVYAYDRSTRALYDIEKTGLPLPGKCRISIDPENPSARISTRGLQIEINKDRLQAESGDVSIDVRLDRSKTTPLRLCSRAGYTGWVYTQKTTPIPVTGVIKIPGKEIKLAFDKHMALMDWTAGFMRRETFWNWAASAAVLNDGRRFGLNLSAGVNETGFTENAFWVDEKMTKIDTIEFRFDPDDLLAPWHIRSSDAHADLTFQPDCQRNQQINAGIIASRFTQMIGRFSGTLKTDAGETITIKDIPGWAEDHFARW